MAITQTRPKTRIQAEKRERILDAALDIFSDNGFRGSTIDQIAAAAGMSKPNLLYYFKNKDEIHETLIHRLLEIWLAPLAEMDENGDPLTEITAYIRRKIEMSRDLPRESRLFANEMLHGAPRTLAMLEGELKTLVDSKAAVLKRWMRDGKIAELDPWASDLLDLGDDPALCRFRRSGPRRARRRARRRRPLCRCRRVSRGILCTGIETLTKRPVSVFVFAHARTALRAGLREGLAKARAAGRPCRQSPEVSAKPGEARGCDRSPPIVWRARAGGERSELAVSEKNTKKLWQPAIPRQPVTIRAGDHRPGGAGVVGIREDDRGGSVRPAPGRGLPLRALSISRFSRRAWRGRVLSARSSFSMRRLSVFASSRSSDLVHSMRSVSPGTEICGSALSGIDKCGTRCAGAAERFARIDQCEGSAVLSTAKAGRNPAAAVWPLPRCFRLASAF